ncbi:hypothetical protein AJ80_05685 [Polytolypa hystricis UAMH7299]|uniref:Major facilitator superfamily (MFS) profile domain-containing protein n=1 Tax=Polytolypa hystricis (strain UAMH7299) TaxID=1447883 RepID=A0A2B7Y1A6_POLH7|nr:hypothetical protein AJ80_05685 [Polytolypa hystricis UAMH7299]
MEAESKISPASKGDDSRIENVADEKAAIQESSSSELEVGDVDVDVDSYSKEETTRIMRRIDYRLIPILAYLYLLSFIDRGNIGNAKIAGMNDDLNLQGMQYNIALIVFFIPYTLFEVPSNIVLKLLRPSIWITIMLFCWGTVMTLMGIVPNYRGLLIARFFLGFAESGFFPAATYLLTIWYKRYEVQRRMAIFYAAASLSGAFSGLLAYGIAKMDGVGGLAGWRWIFILEGLLPVVTAFVSWYLLPDSPDRARFLTPLERKFVIKRLSQDMGSTTDKISLKYVMAAFKEWKIWASVVMFWANTVGVYGFTATVPTVIADLGYSAANAQLLTIPIYVVAMLLTLTFAFLSDRYEQRTPFIIAGYCIAVVGFIAQLAIPHPRYPGLTYAMLFLVAAGLYSPFTSIVCMVANNVAPSSKRAVGMGILISVGNMGGIPGSLSYFAAEAPSYPTGFGLALAMCCAGIAMAVVLRISYRRLNEQRDKLLAEEGEEALRARYTEEELLEMGDQSPFFRYTI